MTIMFRRVLSCLLALILVFTMLQRLIQRKWTYN